MLCADAVSTAASCRAGDSDRILAGLSQSPVKAGQQLSAIADRSTGALSIAPAANVPMGSPLAPGAGVGLTAVLASHSPDALSEYATCLGSPLTCVGTPLQSDAGTWLTGELSPLEGMLSFDNPSFDLRSGLDA